MRFLLILTLILQTYLSARTVSSSTSTTSTSTTVTVTPPPSSGGGGSSSGGSGGGGGSSSGGSGSSTPPPPPMVYLTIGEYTIFSEEDKKGGKVMKFNVAFSAPILSDIILNYEIDTEDSNSNATITLGSDVTNGSSNSVSVSSGSTSVDIIVDVIDDTVIEDAEFFFIKLFTPSSSANRFHIINGQSLGVILDNDKTISSPSVDGNYYIYENDTLDTNIKTKIVGDSVKLDIFAKAGVEILHDIHTNSNTTCATAVCTSTTDASGATVTSCTQDCTTIVTETWEYSESMNIKKVLLHRFRDYDITTSSCINQDSSLTLVEDVNLSSGNKLTVDIPTASGAFRCAYIEVIGVSDTVYTTGLPIMYSGSSDSFAIRPEKFNITMPTLVTAADNFSFVIEALGKAGTPANYYNQSNGISFNLKPSDKIYLENNITTLGFDVGTFSFTNGIGSQNIKYVEVGEVDLNISENPANYFAIVDGTNSYIEPDLKTITFEVANFDVDYNSNKYKNGDFAFHSNNPTTMYSSVDMNITALNLDGDITLRYTKLGYAKDTDITFEQSIVTTGNGVRTIKSDEVAIDTDFNSDGTPANTTRNYTKDDFLDGVLFTNRFKQSFKRAKNIALNPIELKTTKVEIKESLKPTINGSKSKSGITTKSKHYYGRVHVAPDPVTVEGKDLDATVFYEIYCKSCDKTKFSYATNRASIDSVYWYIIPSSQYDDSVCNIDSSVSAVSLVDVDNISRVDAHKINMKVDKIPHANRVLYKPSYDYLLYDKTNSSVVEHKFIVKFTTGGTKWAGEGKLGDTVDLSISKQGNQAVEW